MCPVGATTTSTEYPPRQGRPICGETGGAEWSVLDQENQVCHTDAHLTDTKHQAGTFS